MFHPVVDAWFRARFREATPVQAQAWPLIAAGQDVLMTAPTGSGKTLAAFLACLDRLFHEGVEGRLEDRTAILYVSPLKALSNDVRRNLEEPLGELSAAAVASGLPAPGIRTAVRTGDPPAHERRQAGRRPPHVLVTTPESLFILLTAESSRGWLSQVRTVIVDEIHAVAGDKRGAHLALSLERLEELVVSRGGVRLQRVGLSATVRPIETAARLLVGSTRPMPEVVNVGQRRDMDLAIEVLGDELGAVCTNEQWEEIYDRVAALAREHRSTLVFVNTRRLVERVTRHLADRLGAERVAAHHSSLSRQRRFDAEQRLKSGELSLVVATASLELGIDVGTVDLTCLLGSPRSIATALQRVGRSGHALLATPKGRLFPLTRDQLVECAALARAARRGEIDRLALRDAPLDVLAQQVVAICASEEQDEDRLFALCRRAAPYAALDRQDFDQVVDMLAEGIATRRGRTATRSAGGSRRAGARGSPRSPRAARSPTTPATRWCSSPTRPRSARSTRTSPSSRWRGTSSYSATPPGASAASRAGASESRTRAAPRPPSRSGSARGPRARPSSPPSWPRCGRGWRTASTIRNRPSSGSSARPGSIGAEPSSRATTSRRPGPRSGRCRRATRWWWSASSTRRAACSWWCTRLSGAASIERGEWHCASASATASTSSCRPRPPTTACSSRWARSTASRSRRSSRWSTRTGSRSS